jgi:CHAT domain-containing protein
MNDRQKTLFYSTLQTDFEFFNYFVSQYYVINPALAGDMYNYCIATKALLLNTSNKIKRRILGSGDQALIAVYQEWKNKKNRLAQVWQMTPSEKIQSNIDQAALETEVDVLEKKLSAQSELFAAHSDRIRYTWKDIQKNLKQDEAAVEIIRFRRFNFEFTDTICYAALIVKPGRSNPEIVFIDNGNFLEGKLLTGHKNFIKNRLTDDISYASYWQPLGSRLQGIRKVYLSPDGVYNQINVNGLLNPATKKYLIDEVEVQQVTNTKDILALPKKSPLREAVMIGFPDYKALPAHEKLPAFPGEDHTLSDSAKREMEANITSLPGTLTEVNLISEIFKSKNIPVQTITGMRASEGFLKKLQSPSVLHIATHGYFLPDVKSLSGRSGFMGVDPVKVEENPLLRSGILLAGAQRSISGFRNEGEDGILSAYEAANLNLEETQLIVLSACETGLGEVRNGEGVYGFQRALIIAGAQSIVMSLWKVNDQVTQLLMTEFYRFWMEGLTRRQAFMKAQQKIRGNHPEPYFWAPFILIGE